jgi:antitoxin (DNA-binding transcriptional repressor) of toxin-antitoxin stability system
MTSRGPTKPTTKVVGVRELKTYGARIVRQVRDSRASYILTHRGRAVGVILPLDPGDSSAQPSEAADATAEWNTFLRAGRRLGRRYRRGVSGVQILSRTDEALDRR